MDTFTIVLIVAGAALVLTIAVLEVRGRRRPGHHISQSAAMGGNDTNTAHHTARTNIHNHNDFGGTPGTM